MQKYMYTFLCWCLSLILSLFAWFRYGCIRGCGRRSYLYLECTQNSRFLSLSPLLQKCGGRNEIHRMLRGFQQKPSSFNLDIRNNVM